MSKFTKPKTTVTTALDKSLNEDDALISVKRESDTRIQLVVGALYENRKRMFFDKNDVADLIAELQAIHDAMED